MLSDPSTGMTRLSSANGTFERTDFTSPTGSLTVNAGDGDDVIDYAIIGPYPASVTLDGQNGTADRIQVGGFFNNILTVNDVNGSFAAAAETVQCSGRWTRRGQGRRGR